MDITELLAFSAKEGASDLHISAGLPPIIRIDGDVRRINLPPMEHRQVHSLIYEIMNDKQRRDYEEFLETDFSFDVPGIARFRVNVFYQNRGAAAVFRTIPSNVLTLEQLDMGDIFKKLALMPRGLVLVTGPTGSGKSTTLAAMVADVIRKGEVHKLKEIMGNSTEHGMQTFDQALYELYVEEKISYENAIAHADSKNDLRLMIKMQSENYVEQLGASADDLSIEEGDANKLRCYLSLAKRLLWAPRAFFTIAKGFLLWRSADRWRIEPALQNKRRSNMVNLSQILSALIPAYRLGFATG